MRQQVTDYLLGHLTDSEMEAVETRLDSDAVYRRALQTARRDLNCLRRLPHEIPPPTRLAERTCDYIFDHAFRVGMAARRAKGMSARPISHHSPSRLHWMDACVASVIFLIAGLLILPAIFGARFQARIVSCQENLRTMGVALAEFSQKNEGNFPAVPSEGNMAVAGYYSAALSHDGYLTQPQSVLCPESPQAEQKDFHVPSFEELQSASGRTVARLHSQIGGSYGYCLGHLDADGRYAATRNLNRCYFAVMADAPSTDRPHRQSSNHGGQGQNVLFDDGHVDFCRTTRPGSGNDDIFCNDNDRVAVGLHGDDSVVAASGTPPIISVSFP